jgi:hypothetical protein
MTPWLPPDLDRLGDELTSAAARRIAARKRAARRRRLVLAGVVAALAVAVLTPTGLAPSERGAVFTLSGQVPTAGCDNPEGGLLPECEHVMVLYRPYAVR